MAKKSKMVQVAFRLERELVERLDKAARSFSNARPDLPGKANRTDIAKAALELGLPRLEDKANHP